MAFGAILGVQRPKNCDSSQTNFNRLQASSLNPFWFPFLKIDSFGRLQTSLVRLCLPYWVWICASFHLHLRRYNSEEYGEKLWFSSFWMDAVVPLSSRRYAWWVPIPIFLTLRFYALLHICICANEKLMMCLSRPSVIPPRQSSNHFDPNL